MRFRLLRYRSVIFVYMCEYVCRLSHSLVHPDKAVGRNEMPFGRDTRVVLK